MASNNPTSTITELTEEEAQLVLALSEESLKLEHSALASYGQDEDAITRLRDKISHSLKIKNKSKKNKEHEFKVSPYYFKVVSSGEKTFEIRKNDRNFQQGDTVILKEYDKSTNKYTGNELSFSIGFITDYGQADNYVVFSIHLPKQEVYIVTKSIIDIFDGDHEKYNIGVFSTKQKAEEFANKLRLEDKREVPTFYNVSSFELNSAID